MIEEEISQSFEQAGDYVSTQSKQLKFPGDFTLPRLDKPQNLSILESTAITLIEPEKNTPICKALLDSSVSASPQQVSEAPAITSKYYQKAIARGFCRNILNYTNTDSAKKVMRKFVHVHSLQHILQFKSLAHEITSSDNLSSQVFNSSAFDTLCAGYRNRGTNKCSTDCYCFTVECWRFYEQLFMKGCKLGHEQYEDQLKKMNGILGKIQRNEVNAIKVLEYLEDIITEREIQNPLPLLKVRLREGESFSLGKRKPETEHKSELPLFSSSLTESSEMYLTTSSPAPPFKSSTMEKPFIPGFEEDPENRLIVQSSDHLSITDS